MRLRRSRRVFKSVICVILLGLALFVYQRSQPGDYSSRGHKASDTNSGNEETNLIWGRLGALTTYDEHGWKRLTCNTKVNMTAATLHTEIGNFTVYGSASDDASITKDALEGTDLKKITHFLKISDPTRLIDVGANMGLVTLQAALQKREVVAIEPIFDNAVRLCRAAQDVGHGHLVHVIQNAVSSTEGAVTQAPGKPAKYYAIFFDRVAELLTFTDVALRIAVKGHEAHVLYAAKKLFSNVKIHLVWLEWEHVKKSPGADAKFLLEFMSLHEMTAHDLMSGERLKVYSWRDWPSTVLWKQKSIGK